MAAAVATGESGARWRLGVPRFLPRLGGRAFGVFRIVWAAAAVAAVAGLAIGEYYTQHRVVDTQRSFAAYGLQIGVDVPVRLSFPLSEATRRAGIKSGDRIVAIDGIAVPADGTPHDIAPRLDAAGPVATIRTRDQAGRVADHRIARSLGHAAETYAGTGMTPSGREYAIRIWDTLSALVLFSASVLLFARRPRDPVAAFLSLSFLLLLASYSWTWLLEIAHISWLVALLRPTAWIMMNAVLFAFPSGRFEPRWAGVAVLLMPIPWLYYVLDLPFAGVAILNTVALIAAILSMRARYRSLATTVERLQIKWGMLGFAAGAACLVIAIVATFIVPAFTQSFHVLLWADTVRSFGLITMIASFALGLLVSLLRYRLYDADAIVSRSAGYALLTVMIGALWAGGERGVEHVVKERFGHDAGTMATVIAAVLAAGLVAPAHNRVHRWAEERFQKALSHLRRGLPAFVDDMRETAEVHELLEATLERIERGVRARWGAVLLTHEGKPVVAALRDTDAATVGLWQGANGPNPAHILDCDREDPLFPIRIHLTVDGGRTIGWVLLGPRPDGSFYGKDEREALAEIAEPISRAVTVARRRAARWDILQGAMAALDARIAALETRHPALLEGPSA